LLRDGLFADVPKVAIVLKLRIPTGPQIPRWRELIENVFFDSEQLGEDPKGYCSRKNLDLFHIASPLQGRRFRINKTIHTIRA
jgi:hypothetical protein